MNFPSTEEITKFTRLESIELNSRSTGSSHVCPYTILHDLSQQETDEWAEEMITEGLLHQDDEVILKVGLTPAGKEYIRSGTSRRDNCALLRTETRERLLSWVSKNSSSPAEEVTVKMTEEQLWFYGKDITPFDLEYAARDLDHHGLLDHVSGDPYDQELMVRITEDGRNCALEFDSNVESYLRSKASHATPHETGTVVTVEDGEPLAEEAPQPA